MTDRAAPGRLVKDGTMPARYSASGARRLPVAYTATVAGRRYVVGAEKITDDEGRILWRVVAVERSTGRPQTTYEQCYPAWLRDVPDGWGPIGAAKNLITTITGEPQ
jgi:hypothetical protein